VARLQTELLDLEMEKESGFRNNTKGWRREERESVLVEMLKREVELRA
jgi:hypothetical protein